MARVSNHGRGDRQGWERQDTGRQGQRHQRDRITGRDGQQGTQNASIIAQLQAMGHSMEARGGVGTAPTILRRGNMWTGVPDPRTGGLATGY